MFLQYFFKKENKQKNFADKIYINIVNKSKLLLNKKDYFTIKNYKSSFEIFSIITIFYLKIIKESKIQYSKEINQYLIENLVNDLDKSLTANGIGDMSIGKYVKSYIKKFYYRLSNIDKILNDYNEEDFCKYINKLNIIKKDQILIFSSDIMKIYKEIQNSKSFKKVC